MYRNPAFPLLSDIFVAGSIPGCSTEKGRTGAALLINGSFGEIADLDAQPRLARELEVVMHVGDRYAPFADGCCHTLH